MRLSSGGGCLALIVGDVREHGEQDVDAASGEADEASRGVAGPRVRLEAAQEVVDARRDELTRPERKSAGSS